MKSVFILAQIFCAISICGAQSAMRTTRLEAEHYVAAYAKHYRVPLALTRAIVEHESNWQPCAVSPKGAVGLMQLMPAIAKRLGVTDRCNLDQNVSAGVRYLAWLIQRFHGDLRLVAAAYYVGDGTVGKKGFSYANSNVVAYVSRIRTTYLGEAGIEPGRKNTPEKRVVR